MSNPVIKLDSRQIIDAKSFHSIFAQAMGFPRTYGHTMDAWVDCMSSLDDPAACMTNVHTSPGGIITIQIEHIQDFKKRCPRLFDSLIECAAFVNWRKLEAGEQAILALSFYQ